MHIQENQSLKRYNSWRVGGEAEFFCLPQTEEEFKEAISWAQSKKQPVTLLGGGTNVLISDRGVKGLVICTKKYVGLEDYSDEKTARCICKAGTLKQKAMRFFLKEELAPTLFLSGVPGDVAAGVVMNAGVSEEDTKPKEFVEIVESFKVLSFKDLETKIYNNKEIKWSYRRTDGWKPGVILEVILAAPKKRMPQIKEKVLKTQERRKSKQPLDKPSCGSVFRNPKEDPEKRSAGYLIEQAGLKGYQYGGAEISRKHANFIVNTGTATALDLHCAISLAQNKVRHMFGVELKTEVKYLGDWEGII